jgi:DNA-binding transcriptional ArsR family regulator
VTIVALHASNAADDAEAARLDRVFSALSDPIRRAILERLDQESLLVSEIAAPFAVSLQAVSRHIQVLVQAGLVRQERTGRVSRCSLDTGPIFTAAVWINRYTRYWQGQSDLLAGALGDNNPPHPPNKRKSKSTRMEETDDREPRSRLPRGMD